MPRYTYRCNSCEEEAEVIHRMSEKRTLCEQCGEETLERVPSQIFSTKPEPLQRTGAIVDSYIENAKKEVEREKKILKEREAK